MCDYTVVYTINEANVMYHTQLNNHQTTIQIKLFPSGKIPGEYGVESIDFILALHVFII